MRDDAGIIIEKSYEELMGKILNRLIQEECMRLKETSEKISRLNYQTENFNKMRKDVQDVVVQDTLKFMEENGWSDWAEQLETSFTRNSSEAQHDIKKTKQEICEENQLPKSHMP